jgi:hypothetical protein
LQSPSGSYWFSCPMDGDVRGLEPVVAGSHRFGELSEPEPQTAVLTAGGRARRWCLDEMWATASAAAYRAITSTARPNLVATAVKGPIRGGSIPGRWPAGSMIGTSWFTNSTVPHTCNKRHRAERHHHHPHHNGPNGRLAGSDFRYSGHVSAET